MDNFDNMKEIYNFSKTLFAGNSSLIINIHLNGQAIKFIVKENIKISYMDDSDKTIEGHKLDIESSESIFNRTNLIKAIYVSVMK